MKKAASLSAAVVVTFLAACASAPGPGQKEAEVPPRLVVKDNISGWDNPTAFGPVPYELAEAGQKICGSLDTTNLKFRASGYHARAQDLNGDLLPGGGYFCVRKLAP